MVARYLLLLFMVFQNVFNLLRERFEAKPLVMRVSTFTGIPIGVRRTDLEGTNDMFGRDGFLRVLLANLIRFGRNEVDEF